MPSATSWAWLTAVGYGPIDLKLDAAVFATACLGYVLFYVACRPFFPTQKQAGRTRANCRLFRHISPSRAPIFHYT